MEDYLLALSAVLYYSEERIFNGVVLPSSLKILSISDSSAAFIKKGQRESVIGYVFVFGLPRRRGLGNVRNEMIEKITAYNLVKMLRMKRERRNAEESD